MSRERPLLPAIAGGDEYRALQPDAALWLPAVRAICRRHNLPIGALTRLGEGTNVIFAAGDQYIVKLYPPFWTRLFEAETAVAAHIHGKLGVATPEICAYDLLDGWPYVVLSRLPGRYLADVWSTMQAANRLRIAADLGELMARLHALPTHELQGLDADWPGLVQSRLQTCAERHRDQGVSDYWLQQIPSFLVSARPLYPADFSPAIVSGDVHQYHLLVVEEAGRWRLSGLFDFDDARIGFHEYDLAASGLFLMHGRPELLRTFLHAYGYPEAALDEALSRRLLAYTLLHRYRPFNWVREELVADRTSTTLEQLALAIYAL